MAEYISIHALREEGDLRGVLSAPSALHFYPRPPRGGRLHFLRQTSGAVSDFYPRPPRGGRLSTPCGYGLVVQISIHALREEGDRFLLVELFFPVRISIHALREEGDIKNAGFEI